MNFLLRILVLFCCLITLLCAKEKPFLNNLEKNYLANHKTLNIYIEPDIYFYTYTYGNYINGYAIEYLKELSSKLNIKFNFITNISRKEAKSRLDKGILDIALLPTLGLKNDNSLQSSNLPIGILKPALLIPKIYQIPPNLESIEQFRLAVVKDDEFLPILKTKYPEIEIEIVDNISIAIKKIEQQEVDLAIGFDEIFSSYIDYKRLPKLKSIPITNNIYFPIGKIFLTTSKKNSTLMRIIDKSMKELDFNKLLYLRNQFFHSDLLRQTKITVPLTTKEKFFLMGKQVINMCTIPNNFPYGHIFQNKYEGIGADMIKILEKNLDIPIQLIATKSKEESIQKLLQKECDFLSLNTKTSIKNKNIKHTSTLFESPLVLITSNDVLFISNFNEVLNNSFIILKNHPMISIIKQKYPSIKLTEVPSQVEGLKLIESNKNYGLITSLYSVSYLFRNHIADNLNISAQLPIKMPFNFSVLKKNNNMLSILETSITHSLKYKTQQIINKNVSKKYPKGFDYTIVLMLVIVFVIFFIIMFRQHFVLSLQKETLYKLNENLEFRVQEAVDMNREKDILMYRQNRFASMGEMIGNIAHQWRQPLTELSALLMELQASIHFKNKVSNKNILDVVKSSNKVIKFMSYTIDDFRNFFSTSKKKEFFSINEVVNDSIHIMNLNLQNNKINLKVITHSKNILAYGIRNEYSQVIINIISNAKDMFVLRKIVNGKISITIEEDYEFSKVSIEDNAGGIDVEDLNKIFEPFFTKDKINGTGIGLFMSRMIIENHMKGILTADNKKDGAIFYIKLAKAIKEKK